MVDDLFQKLCRRRKRLIQAANAAVAEARRMVLQVLRTILRRSLRFPKGGKA